eukprot:9431915-Alexandrium_andersonii.AAC.1
MIRGGRQGNLAGRVEGPTPNGASAACQRCASGGSGKAVAPAVKSTRDFSNLLDAAGKCSQ